MGVDQVIRGYLALGMRLGRLVPGLADAGACHPRLAAEVASEPKPDPRALVADALALRAELADTDLASDRRRFLADQLEALTCTARKQAGEPIGYLAEVGACFGVWIALGDQDRYRQAHRELAVLLPGTGPLGERLRAHRAAEAVPSRLLADAVRALSEALRERARPAYQLPDREAVLYRLVGGRPWSALTTYLGGHRSLVAVNADAHHRLSSLPALVAHESYPGHHTEHCRAEYGHPEQRAVLLNTPRCLVTEGLADLGLDALLGAGWGRLAQDVLAELGLRLDGERAEAISRAAAALLPVRQDAALLLHDRAADADEVRDYLARWLLTDEPGTRRVLRFVADPLWRAYTTAYVEGNRLVGAWLAARPTGESLRVRHRRLLDEPLVGSGLRADLATPVSPGTRES